MQNIIYAEINPEGNRTRKFICSVMNIGNHKLREMLRDLGIPDGKELTPKDVKRFREAYLD